MGAATPTESPVEFQRDLYAALPLRLRAPQPGNLVLNRGGVTQESELSPVEEMEGLPPEVQLFLFAVKVDTPGQRQVLVEARAIAELAIVAVSLPNPVVG